MNHKYKQNIYRVNANVNFMVKNVIKIKFRIMINDDMSAKIQKKVSARKVICRMSKHAAVKMINMQETLLTILSLRVMKLQKQ